MNNPYLLIGLEKTPETLRRLFAFIEPHQVDLHPDPSRFSLREVVCHMADWEAIFRERMVDTIKKSDYEIVPRDEGDMVVAHDYAGQDLAGGLERFAAERASTVSFLSSLPAEAFEKCALHPERGPMTIADQAGMMLGHDLYHIEQVSSYLA